ncbi:MAG: flagellar basal body protein FliL [Treponema sp.]|nr:flagellar basal body protein FliL [Treponema sp.]
MIKINSDSKKIHRIIYYILLSITAVLILLILTGTIIGLVRKGNEPLISFGKNETNQISAHPDNSQVFSGLGRLRVPLANSSTLIISIAFPYPADDTAFTEELAAKIDDLKTLAADYFSNLSEENLIVINEDNAKREILRRYNAILRLGRIDVLYFNDMMIIDSIN